MKYIYLQIAHTNDEDCDLFKFSDIAHCMRYIFEHNEVDWIMSDMTLFEFNDNDFTFID